MARRRSLILVPAVLVGLLASAVPALGGAVSSGGPWSYTRQSIVCQFTGDHGAQNSQAFARTTDYNGNCDKLRVRLKANPGPVDWGWAESAGAPASFQVFDPDLGTTAVSSEHRAMHPFDLSWSSVFRPHAF